MLHFKERTPGAYLEVKEKTITWHFRDTDPIFGSWQAKELQLHLAESGTKRSANELSDFPPTRQVSVKIRPSPVRETLLKYKNTSSSALSDPIAKAKSIPERSERICSTAETLKHYEVEVRDTLDRK